MKDTGQKFYQLKGLCPLNDLVVRVIDLDIFSQIFLHTNGKSFVLKLLFITSGIYAVGYKVFVFQSVCWSFVC